MPGNIAPVGNLDEIIEARVFNGTRKLVQSWVKKYPDRFESESHFIRAAIIILDRQLTIEEFGIKSRKVRR